MKNIAKKVNSIIADEKNLKSVVEVPVVSKIEQEILQLLRSGEIDELKIRLDKDKKTIILIEAIQKNMKVDVRARFSDSIGNTSYQTIIYKINAGKMVYFERTTQIKPLIDNKCGLISQGALA